MLSRLTLFTVCCASVPVLLPAGGAPAPHAMPVPLTDSGFESLAGDGPSAWRLVRGDGEPGAAVIGDTAVFRGGRTSLRFSAEHPTSLVVESEPVALEVGHLYRLSGWVRTAELVSDPASRYPTAVPACLSMASFPFTNHSPAVGGTSDWRHIETLFLATRRQDRVRVHLGHNGTATGTAWFDDLHLEKVEDISAFIPPETVRWAGKGFRYDHQGWIVVHIEGEPYERGLQFGSLVADEISAYMEKLAIRESETDPDAGWRHLRFLADTLMLRRYEREYLEEMRGIADGASRAGAGFRGRRVDFLDVVTLNSVVDLGQLTSAMEVTPHPLSGMSFLGAAGELDLPDHRNKCSALAATGPATADAQVVFGQIFMWNGYTGVHWDVMVDVVPASGHRLVYQTFPGGIHSGADFYINSAGIIIGETTVAQTPFNPEGIPQSNRIRRAAQYASTIDEVAAILSRGNNGMYTNDWPMADIKTGEVAIFLLGTHASRMWRTGEDPAPFGLPGFLWANNNNRDPEVRKEYAVQPQDAPFDLVFTPRDRDVAFGEFYRRHAGAIDATATVELWASSPVNRSHACDGKITTSEMAERLVFMAHYGKTTLREKFPERGNRRMPDLPGAIPHLTLGYTVISPVFVAEKLQQQRLEQGRSPAATAPLTLDLGDTAPLFRVDKDRLWRRTLYPASPADNWLVSGTAATWRLLRGLPGDAGAAVPALRDHLADLTSRLLYTLSREEDLPAAAAHRAYDRYAPYQVPRIKGTFVLHQLRLLLGNQGFLRLMNAVHDHFGGREIATADFLALAALEAGRPLDTLVGQWLERTGLPDPAVTAHSLRRRDGGWDVVLEIRQTEPAYHFLTHVEVATDTGRRLHLVEVTGPLTQISLPAAEPPRSIHFNPLFDIPVTHPRFYTWANLVDDFHSLVVVHGTARQVEANHTLALRFRDTVADAYMEILPPLRKDAEMDDGILGDHDLLLLGHATDNALVRRLAPGLPVAFEPGLFRWQGTTYTAPGDGLILVLPNPFNPRKSLYLVTANSALQLHRMTRTFPRDISGWAVFRGDRITARGPHPVTRFLLDLAP